MALLGSCTVARHLATVDPGYLSLFPPDQDAKGEEVAVRLLRYLSLPTSTLVAVLPLAEAMLTCQDDSSQLFIPFVNVRRAPARPPRPPLTPSFNRQEVRVGPADASLSMSVDMDDPLCCSSPPGPPALTPPSSPNVQARDAPWEPLELQLDYWQLPGRTGASEAAVKTDKPSKQDGKTSLKGAFRGLQAVPTPGPALTLSMHLANKEKKQKSK